MMLSKQRPTRASSSRWSTATQATARRARCRPSTRRPCRSGASPSRSRTISTSPACRRPPPVRTMPTCPTKSAPVVERLLAAGAILIGKTNLDQFATGLVGVRTPYPVPRNALDPDLVPGGSSSRLGGRRRARAGQLRARHRHGGLGPRAGGAQQHRRPEAEPRRDLDARRGARLPDARLRLDLRRQRRRRLAGLRGRRRLRSRRPFLERAADGRSRALPPVLRVGVPGRRAASSVAARRRRPSTRLSTHRRRIAATAVADRPLALLRRRRRCSTKAPGSPSATRPSATSSSEGPRRSFP